MTRMSTPKSAFAGHKRRAKLLKSGEKGYVGHWAFYVKDGKFRYAAASDWTPALLSHEEAWNVWKGDKAVEKSTYEAIERFGGPVLFHFYVTFPPEGKLIRLLDCAPGCPTGQELRVLLSDTKKKGKE